MTSWVVTYNEPPSKNLLTHTVRLNAETQWEALRELAAKFEGEGIAIIGVMKADEYFRVERERVHLGRQAR